LIQAPALADFGYDRARLRRMLANEADMAFKRRAEAVLEFLALRAGDRVLDAGCGRGFFLNLVTNLVPGVEITGVELDWHLLGIARAHVPAAPVASASIERLPFASGAFDRVIFTEVLEHIPDDRAAMDELVRVLAPGGTVAITTPHANYPFWWDPINKTLEATLGVHIQTGALAGIWANHVRLYTAEDLARLVTEAGLEIEEVRYLVHHCFPFIHNIVYGIGKPLLERGILPAAVSTAADRFDLDADGGSLLNPVRVGLRLFNLVDRWDDLDPPTADRPFLLLAIKARKPGAVT
jgi:2-polyprenyl-3-methyl-5-hydroxy-6-metoxy-1,4-benzoquinol methylase